MSGYNPLDWYWRVAEDPSRVWTSSRNGYVPDADETYQAWKTARQSIVGYDPTTRIDTEENLAGVVEPYGITANFGNV